LVLSDLYVETILEPRPDTDRGTGFTLENWLQYPAALRRFARKFGVSARDIGRALFALHRELQEGDCTA
jgi:hypothetical protein